MLAVEDRELEDVATLLGSATNDEEYQLSLNAIEARHPDFDPAKYGLGPEYNKDVKRNLDLFTKSAKDNLPHVRAKELEGIKFQHSMALKAFESGTKAASERTLKDQALIKAQANQVAAQQGQPVPYELTPIEESWVEQSTRDVEASIMMQIVSNNLPAFQEALQGKPQKFLAAMEDARTALDVSHKYRMMSEPQKMLLNDGIAHLQKNPGNKQALDTVLAKFKAAGVSKDLIPPEIMQAYAPKPKEEPPKEKPSWWSSRGK
jgi:hypothetical protein